MTQTLHRDVSAGNVLICPTVVRSEVDGQLRVVWKGILTDWELSKPMTPANGKLAARQPVRTVCLICPFARAMLTCQSLP